MIFKTYDMEETRKRRAFEMPKPGENVQTPDVKRFVPQVDSPATSNANRSSFIDRYSSVGKNYNGNNKELDTSWSQQKFAGNMNVGNFVSLAGGISNALAPDDPMGRVGGFLSNYAGREMDRIDKAADKKSERDFIVEGREDTQAHELTSEAARQNRYDTREEKSQNRQDSRSDKEISARRTAAKELAALENERTKIQNAFSLAKTASDRAYLAGKLDDQNARIDKLADEGRLYTEKTLKKKDDMDLYSAMINPPLDELGNPKGKRYTPEAAMKEVLMRRKMFEEGLKPPIEPLAYTNTPKDGMGAGRINPLPTTIGINPGRTPVRTPETTRVPSPDILIPGEAPLSTLMRSIPQDSSKKRRERDLKSFGGNRLPFMSIENRRDK